MLAGMTREEKQKLELEEASQYKYLIGVSLCQNLWKEICHNNKDILLFGKFYIYKHSMDINGYDNNGLTEVG